MYLVNPASVPLESLRVDAAAAVAAAHVSMKEAAQRAAEARNDVIDLLRGTGRFAGAYAPDLPPNAPYDPSAQDILVEGICVDLRTKQSCDTGLDVDLVRDRLRRLEIGFPDHPLVANWRVLQKACYPTSPDHPDWPEFAGIPVPAPKAMKARQAEAPKE